MSAPRKSFAIEMCQSLTKKANDVYNSGSNIFHSASNIMARLESKSSASSALPSMEHESALDEFVTAEILALDAEPGQSSSRSESKATAAMSFIADHIPHRADDFLLQPSSDSAELVRQAWNTHALIELICELREAENPVIFLLTHIGQTVALNALRRYAFAAIMHCVVNARPYADMSESLLAPRNGDVLNISRAGRQQAFEPRLSSILDYIPPSPHADGALPLRSLNFFRLDGTRVNIDLRTLENSMNVQRADAHLGASATALVFRNFINENSRSNQASGTYLIEDHSQEVKTYAGRKSKIA